MSGVNSGYKHANPITCFFTVSHHPNHVQTCTDLEPQEKKKRKTNQTKTNKKPRMQQERISTHRNVSNRLSKGCTHDVKPQNMLVPVSHPVSMEISPRGDNLHTGKAKVYRCWAAQAQALNRGSPSPPSTLSSPLIPPLPLCQLCRPPTPLVTHPLRALACFLQEPPPRTFLQALLLR